jgi:hypothetical protein
MNAAPRTVAPRKVVVSVRNVYGNSMVYPVCADAMNFALIAGTKTLSAQVLAYVAALGFEIVYGGDTQRTTQVMADVARLSQGPRAGFRGVA